MDLDAPTLLRFVIGDFETAWNAVAEQPDPAYRGNFMFGKQAMILLELACRICKGDTSGAALDDFATKLQIREPRYFWQLPAPVWAPAQRTQKALDLPSIGGGDPYSHLLAAIFNLIRNGQAHQYQQMRAVLSDRRNFWISLTGAKQGLFLRDVLAKGRPPDHLCHQDDGTDLWLKVRPEILFLDIRDAVLAARLDQRGLSLKYLVEDRKEAFGFDKAVLKSTLDRMNR
ncbi:MAG TPA: hypothetical protein VLM91_13230 [Candidatus Methylomirabilis sp.]|nr:hypothetical protein [Candidatus Methylomirabilis sp.]